MQIKKCNQKSTFFIKKQLEALFALPKQAVAAKVAVTYKKHRMARVVPETSFDFVLAALIADAKD